MSSVLRASRPCLFVAALLSSCGGGGGSPPAPPNPPLALSMSGVAVVKARAHGVGWAVMVEKLRGIEDVTRPDRQLLVSTDGVTAGAAIVAPAGWSMIDVAVHPSGQLSLVLASDKAVTLQRRSAHGTLIGESAFSDALAATDPFIGDPVDIGDSQSMLPRATRDAVRIAPLGEDLVLAVRTGRNAVVAHRLAPTTAGTYAHSWRTLVEPGVYISGRGLTSGSFDPFNSLDNQWKLQLDVDEQLRIAIAVNVDQTELPQGHSQYFGEPAAANVRYGALATRLNAQGQRQGTTVVDTGKRSELHAMRWSGETLLLAGRQLTERRPDGTGWDAFVARLPNGGGAGGGIQVLDFAQGDVILELAPLGDGRVLLGGATGYWQNPDGGSISEASQPLLAIWPAATGVAQRLPMAAGPRHNQLRTIAGGQGRWLLGGLENGPGTHSADGEPARLVGDGYLRERNVTTP